MITRRDFLRTVPGMAVSGVVSADLAPTYLRTGLRFGGATGDRIVCSGTKLAIGAQGWVFFWMYVTSDSVRMRWADNTVADREWIDFRGDLAGDPLRLFVQRATYLQVIANAANFAAWGLNKPLAVAMTFDTAAAASAQKILIGDEHFPMAEPSAYATQTAGSGTVTSDTATNIVIGNNSAFNTPTIGTFWVAAIGNQYLADLSQLYKFQFAPIRRNVPPGCVGLWYPGEHGTAYVQDHSGFGNHGIVTTAVPSGAPAPRVRKT